MTPPTGEEPSNPGPWWRPALLLFAELSGWIAVPIILAMYFGRWLDHRYQLAPWGYLAAVGVAFIVSTVGIVRGAMREMRRIEQEENASQSSDRHDS